MQGLSWGAPGPCGAHLSNADNDTLCAGGGAGPQEPWQSSSPAASSSQLGDGSWHPGHFTGRVLSTWEKTLNSGVANLLPGGQI